MFARGSGQEIGPDNNEENEFVSSLRSKFTSKEQSKVNNLSLNYPAVSISGLDRSLQQIRNGASAEFEYAEDNFGGDYRHSVQSGTNEAVRQIDDIASKCYEEGTKIVLGGYSQGAHVIGDALFRLSSAAREMIVYAGLFGDPKFKPDSYAARGNFANSNGGILEARNSDFPDGFRGKVESWCLNGDGICEDNIAMAVVGNHGQYPNRFIPAAASKAFINYKRSELGIAFSEHDSMPEPDPLSVNEVLSLQQSSKDIVLLADVSPSTRRRWNIAHGILGGFFSDRITTDNRIGLTLYQSPKRNFVTKQVAELTHGSVRKAFDDLAGSDGSLNENQPMDMIAGIESTLQYQPWRAGTEKKLLIVTDSPLYTNDTSLKEITDIAIRNNLQINIVVKNNVLLGKSVLNKYENLALATGGQYRVIGGNYHRFGGRILNVMLDSFTTPVVKPEGSYEGYAHQPLHMRVTGSYDLDNHILFYEWDFDGDGSYEELTYQPAVIHTYTKPGIRQVQVRANAADGGVGFGSFSAEILPEEAAPQHLVAGDPSLHATEEGTYVLSWQAPENGKPIGYSIYKEDGSLIGVTPHNQNEATIHSDEELDELIIETNYPDGNSEKVRIPFEFEDSNEQDQNNEENTDQEESNEDTNHTPDEDEQEQESENTDETDETDSEERNGDSDGSDNPDSEQPENSADDEVSKDDADSPGQDETIIVAETSNDQPQEPLAVKQTPGGEASDGDVLSESTEQKTQELSDEVKQPRDYSSVFPTLLAALVVTTTGSLYYLRTKHN